MKLTLSWLKEYLDLGDTALDALSVRLTSLGLEVDGISDPGAALAPFVVAEIVGCEQHPNADRLRVCKVNNGTETLQVVCGAPNARLGLKGVFAPSGSTIPANGMVLKPSKIRDVESNGMMCSGRELQLSDDHEGIIELPADAPVGAKFAAYMNLCDPVIEIGLTPNRADCAGIYGIARDLAASGMGIFKPVTPVTPIPSSFNNPIKVTIDPAAAQGCPLFYGRMIKGVKNGPSPDWLRKRLEAVGLRSISTLVDITNYFTMAFGRPLHVYDAAKLSGDIVVSLSKGGEQLPALNDKEYVLPAGLVSINDQSGLIGLGGIVGGTSTGVDDDTVDVYLETALFDPIAIAEAGRQLQIISDARYRFERGVDPVFARDAVELATKMIIDLCGGTASDVISAGNVPSWQRVITYNPDRVAELGGVDVPQDRQKAILSALGCSIEQKSDSWAVTPPSWRGDIHGSADLVEEVLRINGYDQIPAVALDRDSVIARPALSPIRRRQARIRRGLCQRGYDEAVTWSFTDRKNAGLFGPDQAGLVLVNPISTDLDTMRPSILASLLPVIVGNCDRGFGDGALMEIGPAFRNAKSDGQDIMAAGVRFGATSPRHWQGGHRVADVYDAKADALAVLDIAGVPVGNLQFSQDAPGYYHPGRSSSLRLGKDILGYFGELHPNVIAHHGLNGRPVAFEIFMDRLPMSRKNTGPARPMLNLSAFQPVKRDFAFVVAQDVPAEKLVRAVQGADKVLIQKVEIFDIYRGPGVAEGKQSLAVSVTLQPVEKTLSEQDLEQISTRIIAEVGQKTGGVLRG